MAASLLAAPPSEKSDLVAKKMRFIMLDLISTMLDICSSFLRIKRRFISRGGPFKVANS